MWLGVRDYFRNWKRSRASWVSTQRRPRRSTSSSVRSGRVRLRPPSRGGADADSRRHMLVRGDPFSSHRGNSLPAPMTWAWHRPILHRMTVKDVVDIVSSLIQSVGLVLAAGWAYWKFVLQREAEPATDIDVDLAFIGTQKKNWIVQVTATLANKSQVRLGYKDFQVTLRYLLAGDMVEDGDDKLGYQLRSSHTIDERISGKKRFFANSVFINPKQEFRHRYVTFLPGDATFAWVQCKDVYDLGGHPYKTNTQRIFRVPVPATP